MKPDNDKFIFWATGEKTRGIFYEAIKRRNASPIYDIKDCRGRKLYKLIKILMIIKDKNCECVFIDNTGGILSIVIIALSTLFKTSLVMQLGGGMSGEFFDKRSIRNKLLRNLSGRWEKFKRKVALEKTVLVFPVSIFGKSQVLYELPDIALKKIKVIVRPIDSKVIDSTQKGVFRKKLNITDSNILLTATNFNYKRKYEALLEYHPVIVEKLREHPDWVYIILGGGSDLDQFKDLLSKMAPEDIGKRTLVFGFYQNIYEALVDSDLFVYMSYRDMGPRIVKEAQVSGLPVIGNYSCFGSNEFIQNNPACDLLFETHQDLSDLLSKLMSNKDLRTQLGLFNRGYAEGHYSAETAAEIFLSEIAAINRQRST